MSGTYSIGFIGCGNMGSAVLGGALDAGAISPSDVVVSARTQATLDRVHAAYGVATTTDNTVPASARMVFLAVKPQVYPEVIDQIAGVVDNEALLVSFAPGKTIEWLQDETSVRKVVRIMPNTPAAVGEGMTSVVFSDECNEDDRARVLAVLKAVGKAEVIPERLMDAASAVAGCSPAYVYMFIEAMADAAVLEGMPRAQAYRFAAQAVLGSAKMVLETGKHPAELKDAVCSPGGTTIEGLRVLEEKGMRGAVIDALKATVDKAQGL
jgi:pyrroline-5-carboxylate reductase